VALVPIFQGSATACRIKYAELFKAIKAQSKVEGKIVMKVTLKSAYLPYESRDGARYLAESLWPEGVETYRLSPYLWVQELAPSYELKEMAIWKHWSPEKFREEYRKELHMTQRSPWFDLVVTQAREKGVTLLHHSHKKDSDIRPSDTSVYYLKKFIDEELGHGGQWPQPQRSAAQTVNLSRDSSEEAEQWTNEGGK